MVGTRTGHTIVQVDLSDPYKMLRLNRLARELRLTGQILTDDLDTVVVVEKHSAPGSTSQDGTRITLDFTSMGTPWRKQDIAIWLGTFAHEIGHCKFTPRATSRLMRRINAGNSTSHRGIHKVWNIMEDARQERLMLGQFHAWRGYLSAAIAKHIDVTMPEAYVCLVGRTWLPADVKAGTRALFVQELIRANMTPAFAEQTADEIARLIGVYQLLADPGEADSDVAWSVVEQLYRLLGEPDVPEPGNCACGHEPMTGGWPEDGDQAQEAADDAGIPIASDPEPEAEDDESDGEGDGDDEGEGDDDESGDPLAATNDDDEDDESDGDGEGDDDEGDDESDEDGDGQGDDDGDDSDDEGDDGDGGEGDGEQAQVDPKDVRDAMRDGVADMLNEPETKADLDRVTDALDNGGVGQGPDAPATRGDWKVADDHAMFLERDVTDALMDLRDAAEPAWHKRVGSGKLSVRRWLTDPNWTPEDVFDRYDPGQLDCTALEVVLIADVSGSMSKDVDRLGEAVWAIRRAVDALEGTCHALTFADGWSIMPGSDERPDGRLFTPHANGGTNPTGAMREAARLVMESDAMHKLVVMMTDGTWYDDPKHMPAMDLIREHGGTTVFVGLNSRSGSYGGGVDTSYAERLGFDHIKVIEDANDLAVLFRDVAFKMMAESMNA